MTRPSITNRPTRARRKPGKLPAMPPPQHDGPAPGDPELAALTGKAAPEPWPNQLNNDEGEEA